MKIQNVFKNSIWIIVTKVIQSLLGFVISMFTARYLGPSNYGLINYAEAIVSFALPIIDLGFTSVVVHEFVTHPEDEGKILGTTIVASFASSIFSILGIFVFVNLANVGQTETIIVTMIYSIMLIFSAFQIFECWFQAKLLSKYTSIVSLIAYICISAYRILILVQKKNIKWFAVTKSMDILIIAVLNYILYKKLKGSKICFSFATLKYLFSKSKYYIISGMMVTIFQQTDRIMINNMLGSEATGLYSVAVNCATMPGFIYGAIINSFRPYIFESKGISEESFNNNVTRLYSIMIYMALCQGILMTVLAKPLIYIIYGESYMGATTSLSIIVWFNVFSYIGSVRNIWLLSNNKQRNILKIDTSGAVANILLNLIFIPRMGAEGAALASLLTQFFANFIVVYLIKDSRPNIPLMLKSLNPKVLINSVRSLLKG